MTEANTLAAKPDKRFLPAAIGALVGGLFFVAVYGVHVLDPTYTDWLLRGVNDLRAHYLGWCFFRNAAWDFPLGVADTLIYPYKTSIVFTDSIPIVSIFFKLLSPILPEQFQFFGLWELFCFMLQGALGTLLCLRFTRSIAPAVLGGTLFCLSSVLLERTFNHTALTAHWLILLSFLLLLDYEQLSAKPAKEFLYWLILGGLCAGIHQYFIPMCGIFCFGFTVRKIFAGRFITCFTPCAAFIAGALFVNYLAGAFILRGDILGLATASGLGNFSFNLNGFWNPNGYSVIFSALPLYHADQHEGLAYLGLGVMLLCVFSAFFLAYGVFIRKKNTGVPVEKARRGAIVPIVWAMLALICLVLAVSPEVTFNDKLLFSLPTPDIVEKVWSIYRASGRFVWPVIYIIILLALSILLRAAGKKTAIGILAACIALQLYDFSAVIHTRNFTYGQKLISGMTPIEKKLAIMKQNEALRHMVTKRLPYGPMKFMLENAAYKNRWTVNDFFLGRGFGSQDMWEPGLEDLKDDTVLIFSTADIPEILEAGHAYAYYGLGNEFLAATRNPVSDALHPMSLSELSSYVPTYFYPFNNNNLHNGKDIEGVRYLYRDGNSWGPHVSLKAGAYKITITGSNLQSAEYDCVSDAGDVKHFLHDGYSSPTEITYKILLSEPVEDLETRIFNRTEGTMIITSLTVTSIGPDQIEYVYPYNFGQNAGNMSNGEDSGGVRRLYENGSMWGPYLSLKPGAYMVTITGANLQAADFDCTDNFGSTPFVLLDVGISPSQITYKVILSEPATSLETRVFNRSSETMTIESLIMRSIPMEQIEYSFPYSFSKNAKNMHNGKDIDGVRHLYPEGSMWGPYIALDAGTYEVVIEGSNLQSVSFDCTHQSGEIPCELLDTRVSPTKITYRVVLPSPVKALETRVFNTGQETATISSLVMRLVPDAKAAR